MRPLPVYRPQQLGTSDHALLTNVLYGQHQGHGEWFLSNLPPTHGISGGGTAWPANRVLLWHICVEAKCTIDRLWYIAAILAGNVRMGIYADNAGLPDGGALLAEAGPAVMGPLVSIQALAIADTVIEAGNYWIAMSGDNVGGQFWSDCWEWATFLSRGYALVFGALTNPCPATGNGAEGTVGLRVKSVP